MADSSSLMETAMPNGRDRQMPVILFEWPCKTDGFGQVLVDMDELLKESLRKKQNNNLAINLIINVAVNRKKDHGGMELVSGGINTHY